MRRLSLLWKDLTRAGYGVLCLASARDAFSCFSAPRAQSGKRPVRRARCQPRWPLPTPAGSVLEEQSHAPLPPGYAAAGVTASSSGEMLVWAFGNPVLLHLKDGVLRPLPTADAVRPIGAAFEERDSTLAVVDGERARIVRLSRSGHLVSAQPLNTSLYLHQAVHTPAGWYLGAQDSTGVLHLLLARPGGGTETLFRMGTPAASRSQAAVHLSSADDDALLTMHSPPFSSVQVSSSGRVVRSFRPAIPDSLQGTMDEGKWVSLKLLELDAGFVQTLADLTSDRRVLVLYDREGTPARHTLIDVPLAAATSIPARRQLIAMRRAGGLEIVVYGWRWSDGSPPEQEEAR